VGGALQNPACRPFACCSYFNSCWPSSETTKADRLATALNGTVDNSLVWFVVEDGIDPPGQANTYHARIEEL
jgi:hypothetical protein